MITALNNVGSYFTIYGVLALIGIIFSVAAFVFIIATGLFWESLDSHFKHESIEKA